MRELLWLQLDLEGVVEAMGVSPALFGENLRQGVLVSQPIDPRVTPEEFAIDFCREVCYSQAWCRGTALCHSMQMFRTKIVSISLPEIDLDATLHENHQIQILMVLTLSI